MTRPITPTPKLNEKQTKDFLRRVEEDLKIPSYPVPTPKIEEVLKKIMEDVAKLKICGGALAAKVNRGK